MENYACILCNYNTKLKANFEAFIDNKFLYKLKKLLFEFLIL